MSPASDSTRPSTARLRASPLSPPLAIVAAAIALLALAMTTAAVRADHGDPFIDLASAPLLDKEHNGAIFTQGGIGAGTGNFDPFLTLSPQGNADTQQGYNSDNSLAGVPQFDEHYGGGRTHTLNAAAVPSVDIGGTLYREFSLDANEEGGDDFISIDAFKVFLDSENEGQVSGYDPGSGLDDESFSTAVTKIYDMDWNCPDDDCVLLMRSQTFTPGSGVSDVSVALPDSLFPEECFYGSTECDSWVVLYTHMGGYQDDDSDPIDGEQDWDISGGFEEWRTQLLPVVNVEKTAETTVTVDYGWTVDKRVKVGGTCVDNATVDLFTGDSQDAEWCITATREEGTLSNPVVSGTITITNPTGGDAIEDSIPATILSVTDNITFSNITGGAIALDCPVTFPTTLGAGDSIVCTYSYEATGADADTTGTNTVTVVVEDAGTDFTAEAGFDFGDPDNVTELNATATLTDDEGPLDQAAVSGVEVTYIRTYSCDADEGTTTNTATVTPDDGGTADSDDATLTLNCHQLTVTKDADTSLERTHLWDIDKTVTPDTWDLFTGESGTSRYTVTVTKTGTSDAQFAVSGSITVSNVGNPIDAVINDVTDAISGVGAATVDCGAVTFPHTITAGGTLVCSYSADLPDDQTRANTATATQQNYAYDEEATATEDGTTDYSGNASVDFSEATVTDVNDTVNVNDSHEGPLGSFVGSNSVTYDLTFSCDGDEGANDNTATIVETGQNDSASVTVNCHQIAVTKDADTTFTRTWEWDIDKSVDDGDVVLALGQPYFAQYTVVVSPSSEDSDWAVSGNITVSNVGNPIPATINSVSDIVSGPVAASVDCGVTFPHVIAAGGTLSCTYSAALPDGSNRTNTATATQQLFDYDHELNATADGTSDTSGNAAVTFGDPTSEVDECIDVEDSEIGPLGTVCADDDPADFTIEYEIELPGDQCGVTEFPNVASFVTNDTEATGEDTVIVIITIECPIGCTLTQGYWKTHSIYGPAPYDDTWALIGEDTAFFLSGQSYYDVMWTPPKGGNAYYILAHQYIAAELNFLNGADPSAAQAAFDAATALFETNTPDDIGKLKGKNGKELRSQFIELAGILASFNEGDIGPGHCDEDGNSAE